MSLHIVLFKEISTFYAFKDHDDTQSQSWSGLSAVMVLLICKGHLTTQFTALLFNSGRLSRTSHIQTQYKTSLVQVGPNQPRSCCSCDFFCWLKIDTSCHNTYALKVNTVLDTLLYTQFYVREECLLGRRMSKVSLHIYTTVHKKVCFSYILLWSS